MWIRPIRAATVLSLALGGTAIAADDAMPAGGWRLKSASSDGKPFDAKATWGTLTFQSPMVMFPNRRQLYFEIDKSKTPNTMRIFNRMGDGSRINIYACRYKLTATTLDITFNAGEDFPTAIDSKDSVSIEVHYVKQ